mgnify:CR=1 FL=1
MDEYDILITEQAESNLDEIIYFLQTQWSARVKIDFLATVAEKMQLLATMPYLYKASATEPDVRACLISRQVTMYYRVSDTDRRIEVLSFKDNRRGD